MAAVQQRTILVAGRKSPCLEAGGEAGEAAVFVHGNPGSCEDWRALIEQVGDYGRALAVDMPGFGAADKPADFDYSVPGYAAHLDAVMRELKITRAHLVLHDFGGPWGLTWAAQHPEQVASVTLVNIGILPGYSWHYLARIWRTPIVGELFQLMASRAGFHLLFKHGNPRGLPAAFIDQMYDRYDAGTKRAVLRLYRASGPEVVASFSAQVVSALQPRDIPALVVWGACDPYVPVAYAEAQKEVFPHAQIVILPQSGHWPFADDPAGVASHVVPFLRRQMAAKP
ncbi:MAG: alpha/beta hydrolase [Gammaproteobacteria bacterium]|nr:alpha/beta hydrolase [Gammaproteobacteria bacterium]